MDSVGDLIRPIVTFFNIIEEKLYDYITKDILVLSPSTLKQESCKNDICQCIGIKS